MASRHSAETIEVANCRTNVLRAGKGPPVLFLHGLGGAHWTPFLDELSARHEVFAPDHPGFGASDTPEWLDSVGDLAYFYLDLIERLGLNRVDVVGSDLGGWIALEMAIRCQHAISSLVLAAPAGIHAKGHSKADIFIVPPDELAKSLYHDPALSESAAAEVRNLTPDRFDVQIKDRASTARLVWQPYFYNPSLRNWLHRVKAPTLIVWGRNDRVFPVGHAEPLKELIPGARLSILDNCGHLPHVERKAEFTRLATQFIEETER